MRALDGRRQDTVSALMASVIFGVVVIVLMPLAVFAVVIRVSSSIIAAADRSRAGREQRHKDGRRLV